MSLVSLTESAKDRIVSQMKAADENVLFFCTNSKGCGGNGYQMGFIDADEIEASDEVIDLGEERKFVVDAKSVLLLAGTTIDWVEHEFAGSFTFNNPNAAGNCGCGASFHTEQPCG